jgi:hypothetical protein
MVSKSLSVVRGSAIAATWRDGSLPTLNQDPNMKTEDIAKRLIAFCKEAKWEAAQRELFADDAVSIEPMASHGFERETRGLPAIIEKGHKFDGMVEKMHSISVGEPILTENAFACKMTMDVTMKGQGRMNMAEICVYTVKDGKIKSEQFFL